MLLNPSGINSREGDSSAIPQLILLLNVHLKLLLILELIPMGIPPRDKGDFSTITQFILQLVLEFILYFMPKVIPLSFYTLF